MFDVPMALKVPKAFVRRQWVARGAISMAVIALVAVFLSARNGTAPAPASSTAAPGEPATETAGLAADTEKTVREPNLPGTLSSFGSAGKTDALISALSTMADDPLVPTTAFGVSAFVPDANTLVRPRGTAGAESLRLDRDDATSAGEPRRARRR